MKIHFCKSNNLGGWLIRLFTFSRWNHAAVEVDGLVWDSTARYGVRVWTLESFHNQWDEIETRELSNINSTNFLRKQLGKKYDWTALFAFPFRKDWDNPDKWFCSELVMQALISGGYKFTHLPAYRITPRDLWILTGGSSERRPFVEKD